MHDIPRDTYRETEILTATPQRLRLMLIEGALRAAREALEHRENGAHEAAFQTTTHCRDIVLELMTSVRGKDELSRKVAALYGFLFQTLTMANAQRDARFLRDAISVLDEERTTWLELCQQLPDAPEVRSGFAPAFSGIPGDDLAAPVIQIDPYSGIAFPTTPSPGGQISFDA